MEPSTEKVANNKTTLHSKDCNIPKVAQITKMKVELYGHPFGLAEVDIADIPNDQYGEVLAYFKDWKKDEFAHSDVYEIGTVRIVLRDGSSCRICWYWYAPGDDLLFSSNGMRYRSPKKSTKGDGTLQFDEFVRSLIKPK